MIVRVGGSLYQYDQIRNWKKVKQPRPLHSYPSPRKKNLI